MGNIFNIPVIFSPDWVQEDLQARKTQPYPKIVKTIREPVSKRVIENILEEQTNN